MRVFHALLFNVAIISTSAQNAQIGGFNVYYGSLHNHCEISDGKGTAAEAYASAKAKYDFFGLSDHGEMMSWSEWNTIKDQANASNEEGVFVTFWGFEWSSPNNGHALVVGSVNYCSAISLKVNSFIKLIDWVNANECIAFFNHPGDYDYFGTEFDHFDITPSEKFVGMELWNGSRKFDKYYYNDGYHVNDGNLSYFDEALHKGWKIGAAGEEDNHNADWGSQESRMAVLASDLTRNDIMEAMKSRRFYSTLDKNIEISFKIQGREMGSTLHSGSCEGEINLYDADNELFTRVELLRNGIIYNTFELSETNPQIPFTVVAGNGDYYYIRVYQQDGDQAISSPVFFDDQIVDNILPEISTTGTFNGPSISIRVQQGSTRNYIRMTGIYHTEIVTIADLTGRFVSGFQVGPGEVSEIPDDDLPGGVYLVFIADHPEVPAQKLFITH
jgi:hypothetical protein